MYTRLSIYHYNPWSNGTARNASRLYRIGSKAQTDPEDQHEALVAQWLEHWSYEPRVGGSNPPLSISENTFRVHFLQTSLCLIGSWRWSSCSYWCWSSNSIRAFVAWLSRMPFSYILCDGSLFDLDCHRRRDVAVRSKLIRKVGTEYTKPNPNQNQNQKTKDKEETDNQDSKFTSMIFLFRRRILGSQFTI